MQSLLTFTDSSQLQELLQNPSTTLEDVLDQENIVQELKESNPDLISFLVQSKAFDILVSYSYQISPDSIKNSEQSTKDSKLTKFPYVASEILSSGNAQIVKRFLEYDSTEDTETTQTTVSEIQDNPSEQSKEHPLAHQLFIKFLTFLDSPAPIDFTLAGYFCKVLKSVFQVEGKTVAEILFNPDQNYVKKMIPHLYCDSIQDLLLAIVKLDASFFKTSPLDHYLSERTVLIEQMIETIFEKSIDNDDIASERLVNCSCILTSVLCGYSCFSGGKKIISPLLNSDFFYKIIEGLLNHSLIKPLMPLVQQLCTHYKDIYSSKDKLPLLDLIRYTECVVKPKIPDTEPFVIAVRDTIDKIVASIKLEKHATNIQPTQNQENPNDLNPNQRRVSLCEIMLNFLKLQNSLIDAKIIENEGLTVLLDMFIKNPWNSILHNGLTKLFTFIIEHGSSVLKENLMEQAKIIDFIIKESAEPEIQVYLKTGNKTKKSYIAHLNVLSNLIDGINDSTINNFCENHEGWQTFKTEILKPENDKNKGISDKKHGFSTVDENEQEELPRFKVINESAYSPRQEDIEKKPENNEWEEEGPEMTPKSSKASQKVGWDSF